MREALSHSATSLVRLLIHQKSSTFQWGMPQPSLLPVITWHFSYPPSSEITNSVSCIIHALKYRNITAHEIHRSSDGYGNYWSENFFRRAVQNFCGHWIRLTRNARVCTARSGKVGSSHCYLDRRQLHEIPTFDQIVMTKSILNNWLRMEV